MIPIWVQMTFIRLYKLVGEFLKILGKYSLFGSSYLHNYIQTHASLQGLLIGQITRVATVNTTMTKPRKVFSGCQTVAKSINRFLHCPKMQQSIVNMVTVIAEQLALSHI